MKHPQTAPGARKSTAPAKPAASRTTKAAAAALAAHPDGQDREQRVRETAYYFYEARGCIGGHDMEDWLRAEAEVERATGTQRRTTKAATH